MSDDDPPIELIAATVHVGPDPPQGDGWTKLRCICGDEGTIPTHHIPLIEGRPVRDWDGVRLALCGKCQQGNRAARRKTR